jgi:hypothetical protein
VLITQLLLLLKRRHMLLLLQTIWSGTRPKG